MPDEKIFIGKFLGVTSQVKTVLESPIRPSSGYAVLGEVYSPMGPGSGPGTMAADPILYERSLERLAKLPPGQNVVHALTQVGLFAQNVYGNVWNPEMVAPLPIRQNFVRPARDLPSDGNTEYRQVQLGGMVDDAMNLHLGIQPGANSKIQTFPGDQAEGRLSRLKSQDSLSRIFDNVKQVISNGLSFGAGGHAAKTDPLADFSFKDGVIPMRLKGENKFGFSTFKRGESKSKVSDDESYVPLSFTDLRPVGDVFRTVYFRPLLTNFSENFSPEWNKSPYFGRVDPVVSYQSTGRTISLGFKLVAFGPEDVRTIYQKLHWLTSMVYPEYDSNLVYRSGPVVRLRLGDVVNASSVGTGRGLPGIIESLDFDYSDALWELKEGFKVPRNVEVSLTFLVLHDVPIGRGIEGKFGGLGEINSLGKFVVTPGTDANGEMPDVHEKNFRDFGGDESPMTYDTLATADTEYAAADPRKTLGAADIIPQTQAATLLS